MSSANKWPTVKLGEVAEILMGQAPPSSATNKDGLGYPLIAGAGDFSPTGIEPTKFTDVDTRLSEAHDIVISIRATIGPFRIADKQYALGRGVASIRASNQVNNSFLAHCIQYSEPALKMKGKGATFLQISRRDLSDLDIPLPPLDEQQRIAEILETSAEIIHKEEHLQRSILPLAVNVVERKVAPSDSTLGNLIESMSSGKNVAESPDPNQKNRVLKVSAVTSGTFKPAESKPLPDTYLPPKAHQVRKGDILVSRANTTELLGASALVENDVESLYLPDKIWRVTPKDGVDPYLLWGILQTKTVRARISQRATGSSGSMKNISQKNFLQVPCATFSRSESAKLTALIREAVSVYHQIAQNLTLLRSLHHSLSTRAFAGQL